MKLSHNIKWEVVKVSVLVDYGKKYWKLILAQLFFASLWVASQLIIPRLMVDIIDHGILKGKMVEIVYRGILMLLATLVNILSLLTSLYFLTRANGGVSRDLRRDLFSKIIDWSKSTRNKFSNSTLITRTVNDVKQVSNFIDLSLRKIYTLTITVIGSVIISFSLDPQLASITLIIIPIMLILTIILTSRALPQYSKIREAIDKINLLFRENLTGIMVVKVFNKTAYEKKEFKNSSEDAFDANLKAESTMMLLSPLVLLFTNLLVILILFFGGQRGELGTISLNPYFSSFYCKGHYTKVSRSDY